MADQSRSLSLEASPLFPPSRTYSFPGNSSSAIRPSSELYVTFKVLQLVSGFRQRLKTRVRTDRPNEPSKSANEDFCQEFERRACAEVDRYLGRKRFNRQTKTAKDPLNLGTSALPQANTTAAPATVASRKAAQHRIRKLVQDLDQEVKSGKQCLSRIARNQEVFLKRQADFDIKRLPIKDLVHRLVLVRDLLDTLRHSSLPVFGGLPVCRGDEVLDPLFDEQIVANLVHLLLCLQNQLLQLIVARCIELLLKHVEDCQKNRRVRCHEHIFEYPDCKRPLSTTWPWTIRPSLAVLWGVCWMFYDYAEYFDTTDTPIFDAQGNMVDSAGGIIVPHHAVQQYRALICQPHRQQSTFRGQTSPVRGGRNVVGDGMGGGGRVLMSATEMGRGMDRTNRMNPPQATLSHTTPRTYPTSSAAAHSAHFHSPSTPRSRSESSYNSLPAQQLPHDHGLGAHPFPSDTYITAPPPANASFSDDAETSTGLSSWPTSGLDLHQDSTFSAASNWFQQNSADQSAIYSQPSITFSAPQDATSLPPRPLNYNSYPRAHLSPQRPTYMPPDRENMQTPVSPISAHNSPNETAGDQLQQLSRKRSHSVMSQQDAAVQNAINHSRAASVGSQNAQSPGEEYSPRGSRAFKRSDPPMNGGKYVCDFSEECVGQTFDRKCEWSKHMDKHDRPYRCPHPSCAKLQGFTYSGGLLRHEREVHGKHGGPKAQLMCPHPDCKRHSGKGFTRKENLNEHLRRVHAKDPNSQDQTLSRDPNDILPGADEAETPPSLRGVETTDPALTSDMKRKRMPSIDETLYDDPEGLKHEVKRLRAETEAKDMRIRELEAALSHVNQYPASQAQTATQD